MTYPVYKVTGQKRLSTLLKYECNPQFCREAYTLKGGDGGLRDVKIGTLLAVSYASGSTGVTFQPAAQNAGDGVMVLGDPAYTSAVREGNYIVTCATPGPDGTSKFRVESPEGKTVGTATGGQEFVGHVRFTISGGGTDFAEGDTFVVSVSIDKGAADNRIVAWDASQDVTDIWGLAINDLEAQDGLDASGGLAITDGPAIISASGIVWPDGISDDAKDDVLTLLQLKGIKAR